MNAYTMFKDKDGVRVRFPIMQINELGMNDMIRDNGKDCIGIPNFYCFNDNGIVFYPMPKEGLEIVIET